MRVLATKQYWQAIEILLMVLNILSFSFVLKQNLNVNFTESKRTILGLPFFNLILKSV